MRTDKVQKTQESGTQYFIYVPKMRVWWQKIIVTSCLEITQLSRAKYTRVQHEIG